MAHEKILVIDDSAPILAIMETLLTNAGYRPYMANTGRVGIEMFDIHQPDLIILDISMPVMDGWEVCARIREKSKVPIIILSAAHVSSGDKIKGLDLGANDYIIKPFHQQEFLARVRANLRIAPRLLESHEYQDSFLNIDLLERRVLRNGRTVDLTEKEFGLLRVLIQSAEQTVDNETLFEKVWGYPESFDANYVRIYMSSLRRKLEPDPKSPSYILTERGVGYRFVPSASSDS